MFFLTPTRIHNDQVELNGNNHYKFMSVCRDKRDFYQKKKGIEDFYTIWDETINKMVYCNNRQFANKSVEELVVLSVDLETIGLLYMLSKQILLIPVAYQINGDITTKLFSIDEYDSERDMIVDFLDFLKKLAPQVMVGHNLFGFDLPYFKDRFEALRISHDWIFDDERRMNRKFRVDGGLAIEYRGVDIPNVEIVDTLFLTKKADIKKEFVTYKLKSICAQLGINQGRQNYDASQIGNNWHIPEEREKIKAYAKDDALDALHLYNKYIPPFFHILSFIPMNLQEIINKASGGQINTMFIGKYLSENHSIPKADEIPHFEGGISKAFAGVYRDCLGFDVVSMYPSIIVNCGIRPKKDELGYLASVTQELKTLRLDHKANFKKTGDSTSNHIQESLKIIINSFYGFLGTNGLNFNSYKEASAITEEGRKIITQAVDWSIAKGFNPVQIDTDGFIVEGADLDDQDELVDELNKLFPDGVDFESDPIEDKLKSVVMSKAKNYAKLDISGKVSIKGNSFKSASKEIALKEMCEVMLKSMLGLVDEEPTSVYLRYVQEATNIKDINRWTSKTTYTDAVVKAGRLQEEKKKKAADGLNLDVGDKYFTYIKEDEWLGTPEEYDGKYHVNKYVKKVHNAAKTLASVIDIKQFPNYGLKGNKDKLERLTG
jgi:DNA polymerase elongation subunit (family B)